MRRAPGWITIAAIALELGALAYLTHVLMERPQRPPSLGGPPPDNDAQAAPAAAEGPRVPDVPSPPMEFITESADENARFYRVRTQEGSELFAGFYSDGRVRFADAQNRRFAGMLQGNHADLLELGNNQWSEVFLRTTPAGGMQLELRGGPYDARVLTCEPLT